MHGNVFEWVFDRFGNYSIDQANDPEGPAIGASRVLRGGSWTGAGDSLRSALRSFTSPGSRYGTVGFRLCLRKSRPDRKPPELSASTDLYYYAGFPISLPSVEAHDVRDGNLTTEVLVSGTVNPDSSGNWRIQCVPPEENSFDCRKKLPEPWRGVRNDALDKLTDLSGCIFVHAAGFIGGAKTYDTAYAMAKMSVSSKQ